MLVSIGILGEYIAKLYEQSKERPLYIVARTFGMGSDVPIKTESSDAAAHTK
jgi:hypothetical protein